LYCINPGDTIHVPFSFLSSRSYSYSVLEGIFLAFGIMRYAKRLAEKANDIPGLLNYLPDAGFSHSELKKASEGIQILTDSVTKRFSYVRGKITWN